MLEKALFDPEMDADYYKIYPTTVTPFTKIAEWYREGSYKPYADRNDGEELVELLIWFKQHIQEWKRINRIPRDIPNQSILGGNNKTNLRQIISSKMSTRGLKCRCIRCREIKNSVSHLALCAHVQYFCCNQVVDLKQAVLVERMHSSSGGLETFISFETPDLETLLGLRINGNSTSNIFPELLDAVLIRELHVCSYGVLVPTYEDDKLSRPQHFGFGRRLMARAERLVRERVEQRKAQGRCDIRRWRQTVLCKPGISAGRGRGVHGETSQRAVGDIQKLRARAPDPVSDAGLLRRTCILLCH
eukprot:765761-Hanusia_phi.AAC.6